MTSKWLAAAIVACTLASAQEVRVDGKVPAFALQDLAGKIVSFPELSAPATVVAFISAECPISNAFNDRMSALYKEYAPKGAQFLFVNANANESTAEIIHHARGAGFTFPVYKDLNNRTADIFGAMATPETYVIDSRGLLKYHGDIDDSSNAARVKNHGLQNAIEAVLSNKPVPAAETKAFGCSIKRVRSTT